MKTAAFVDLDGIVFNDDERARIATERTNAHMRGLTFKDEKEREEERLRFFYSTEALYDESLFPLDTVIEGAKEKIAELDMHSVRVTFVSSAPEYCRKARIEQLEKAGLLYMSTSYGLPGYIPMHELMLKVAPFKFDKTVRWKAGIICTLSAAWFAPEVIVVDNEKAILDEVVANILQPCAVYLSLTDLVL
jgi:hypothetical protein